MRLFAAGHNAWKQLTFSADTLPDEPADVSVFIPVLGPVDNLEVVCARLTYTLVSKDNDLVLAGCPPMGPSMASAGGLRDLAVVTDNQKGLPLLGPPLTLGEVCAAPDLLSEFYSSDFVVNQVVAYHSGIVLLLQNKSVWVYGDSRYPNCLGGDSPVIMPETETETCSSALPKSLQTFRSRRLHRVSALDDLPTGPIKKVDAGGYTLAALTEGGDVYAWGGRPGQKAYIEELWAEPAPLDLEFDVADIAIGTQHMIILTTASHVLGRGCSRSGQLGRYSDSNNDVWVDDWERLDIPLDPDEIPVSVCAGPYASFIVTKHA
ncbi:uncharacterized protein BROUX77_001259 [Berkeleyomyces rouxiae]|uniref:uncharacterized protein n=1 Tax=Berkeleyomyces rouxiae TaxID=2035830 RepID=UPI003B7F09B0